MPENERAVAESIAELERSLAATEALFGVQFTIIDHNGALQVNGERVLGSHRQSHQSNLVCRLGFTPQCITHCRYEVSAEATKTGGPFVHHCWKGLQEVVAPLIWRERLVGMLYAGIWPSSEPPDTLPSKFTEAYNRLPMLTEDKRAALLAALPVVAAGIVSKLDAIFLGGPVYDRAAQIRLFVHRNYPYDVTLNDLADELGLSPSRTSHVVKELCGLSFQDLRTQFRINAAKSLLDSTTLPVHAIGRQVGMPDPHQFNRQFKSAVGCSPGRYRRRVTVG